MTNPLDVNNILELFFDCDEYASARDRLAISRSVNLKTLRQLGAAFNWHLSENAVSTEESVNDWVKHFGYWLNQQGPTPIPIPTDRISAAKHFGLEPHNLDNLVSGKADIGTASALGITTTKLQEFLDGTANTDMGVLLHISTAALQDFLYKLGKRGAVGFILGLLIKQKDKR